MVGSLFAKQDPWQIVPERYRPPRPKPRVMSQEERAIRAQIAINALTQMYQDMSNGQ